MALEKYEDYWTDNDRNHEKQGTKSVPSTKQNERTEKCLKAAVFAYLETLPLDSPGVMVLK